jgi:Membrane bound beta barrel domain (DUF5777)
MRKIICTIILGFTINQVKAQDSTSLLKNMDDIPAVEKVTGTFKSTRVIMSHSTEMLHKGDLDFRIMHRFGVMKNGFEDLFGIDYASMRMSFDYGISDRVMMGLGRSTALKDLDIFIKTRILQQAKGEKQMPVSLLIAAGYIVTTQKSYAPVEPDFGDRSSYYLQLIVGRKFNNRFSMQFNPLVVHNNSTLNPTDDNTILGLGAGARYKISKRIALMLDYAHVIGQLDDAITDPLSIGVDIETGGHVFQLHLTNATGMNEKSYLTQTTGKWLEGEIRFGFNLSRIFSLGKKHKKG